MRKRRYTFGNDEFSVEAAYHDCKLVFDGISDEDSFQKADTGLILYYANEIIYALHKALKYKNANVLSNDCISRQAAIDYCYQLINVEHQHGSDEMNYGQERVNQTETILHHLELMPSAEPQWIPCSERLPEEEEKVLIFQTYDRNCNVTIGYIKGKECFDNGSYSGGYWEWFITDKNSKSMCRTACPGDEYVKGWMPLPKPYEGDI